MSWQVIVDSSGWTLTAPDGSELSTGSLPVTLPNDVSAKVEMEAGSLPPIINNDIEVQDQR